ncbi:hypothetical protein Y032_0023g660 [Ancylostoma ceylanicum]|uniref:Tyrosine-protein phosphatase domain-containing protein n=1 Tax=Ancylostoma ceylanicum TaxID=53326 RepID=A0A016UY25_9BILA|nr:hypothetical protein Y032_0023g660 [Ancylostoma ceylanicum]
MRSSSITRATEGFGVVPSAVTLYLMAALELAEMQENFSELEKSRQKAKPTEKKDDTSSVQQFEETPTPADTSEDMNPTLRTAFSVNQYEENIASCLKAFASMCDTFTVDVLRNQFYSLPKPDPAECVVFGDPSNACKNRYSNVPCLDVSRILLEFLLLEDGGGYIHANRVTYPLLRNQFILTQGPLPRTIPEFWRMIWQEKVETIIMLCRNVENGKRKCAEYIPSHIDYPSSYVNGLLTIILRSRYQESDMIISAIELRYLSCSRTIIHYHWVAWPDCQVIMFIYGLGPSLALHRVNVHHLRPCVRHQLKMYNPCSQCCDEYEEARHP